MLYSNPNIFLRIAQADAYAAAVEYVKLPQNQALVDEALTFERYLKHPTHSLNPGKYTDDTQMSIAIAELIIDKKDPSIYNFADYFLKTFKRDQRDGYARGFQKFLEETNSTEDFLKNIIPTSEKNGAAMRATPIGMIKDVKEVIEIARVQASVTHDSIIGTWGSIATALMSHFAHYIDDDLKWIDTYVDSFMPKEYSFLKLRGKTFEGKITNCESTILAVKDSIINCGSLMDILKQIIVWGGDTDSAAAIAWGIASARYPEEDIPVFMEAALEPYGKYGVDFLKSLGASLIEAV